MILKPLSGGEMEQVRQWRLGIPETLRTPYMLTTEMQQQYYQDVICDRESHVRYWGLWIERTDDMNPKYLAYQPPGVSAHVSTYDAFIGMGGIENIQWENGIGEISLLISPGNRGRGYGREAVRLILDQAFKHMRLHAVWGECYECSPAVDFWKHMTPDFITRLLCRKYYDGQYWGSLYFTFVSGGNHEEETEK